MRKILNRIGLVAIVSLSISGAFIFGNELRKNSELRSHREHVRFQRDSLQLEIYKKQLKIK
jgi:hypothetical protein